MKFKIYVRFIEPVMGRYFVEGNDDTIRINDNYVRFKWDGININVPMSNISYYTDEVIR